MRRMASLALMICFAVGACSGDDSGPLAVVYIGDRDSAFTDSLRLSDAAQHVRAATSEGLVSLDESGSVVPGLADRWIVTDEGRSFVFRLRDGEWPDGSDLTADSVRREMNSRIRALAGTSLALDLAPITEIRTMAERVVEFRLSSPVPDLLQIMAQPELALTPTGDKSIPMGLFELEERTSFDLAAPNRRGLPVEEEWQEWVRRIDFSVGGAAEAVEKFDDGEASLILGGTVGDLPLAEVGALSRGTVRLDPAIGLFGLQARSAEGFLSDATLREALAMAIDRENLIAPFNIGGWVPNTGIAPIDPDISESQGRWSNLSIEERRAVAASRLAVARNRAGGTLRIKVHIGEGPGADVLAEQLQSQWSMLGVAIERVDNPVAADLYLVDRVARYSGIRWFLNQFHCGLERGLCSPEADGLVAEAIRITDAAERDAFLLEAQDELTRKNVFIPFGAPIRWSLVRSNVTGFAANQWAFHPLPPLAKVPR